MLLSFTRVSCIVVTKFIVEDFIGVDVVSCEIWSKYITSSTKYDHFISHHGCYVEIPFWDSLSLAEREREREREWVGVCGCVGCGGGCDRGGGGERGTSSNHLHTGGKKLAHFSSKLSPCVMFQIEGIHVPTEL